MPIATAPLRVLEALASPHGVDRYLELVHPMLALRELRAQVTDVTRHPHAVTLTLRPNRRWDGFRAGQYVQLAVDIDGVRHTRCYSPACSQHRDDGRFELTVKSHDGGRVSQYLYAHARPGLVVDLTPAQGTFTLPDERPDKLLLVSGGSGITPVLSMLRTLCDEQYAGQIAFLHYAPTADHIGYLPELRRLADEHPNVSLFVVHTRDAAGDLSGRFGEEHLRAVAPWFADAESFVCGPPALMAAARELYESAGIAGKLHTEQFTLTSVPVSDDASGEVTFAASGATAANSGATLLEQAEAAGLSPDYGCRMGICFTCTRPKLSGCTRDVRTGELNADPDVEIQLCVNVPVGDVAVDV